jgi:hypothetical protein
MIVIKIIITESNLSIRSDESSSSSNNSIQFNLILIYLCANLTAQRPITKSAQVQKKKKYTYKENTKNKVIKIIIIIIII